MEIGVCLRRGPLPQSARRPGPPRHWRTMSAECSYQINYNLGNFHHTEFFDDWHGMLERVGKLGCFSRSPSIAQASWHPDQMRRWGSREKIPGVRKGLCAVGWQWLIRTFVLITPVLGSANSLSLDFDLLKRALRANRHSFVTRFYASSEQLGVLGLDHSCRRTDWIRSLSPQ